MRRARGREGVLKSDEHGANDAESSYKGRYGFGRHLGSLSYVQQKGRRKSWVFRGVTEASSLRKRDVLVVGCIGRYEIEWVAGGRAAGR